MMFKSQNETKLVILWKVVLKPTINFKVELDLIILGLSERHAYWQKESFSLKEEMKMKGSFLS